MLFSAINTSAQKSSRSQPSTSDNIGRAVQVTLSRLDHYPHEEIYRIEDQLLVTNNSLRNIGDEHCRALAESFHTYNLQLRL